jgi:hypothetical protein
MNENLLCRENISAYNIRADGKKEVHIKEP